MNPKDIIKRLSEFKSDEDRVKFLRKLAESVEDKNTKMFLESIIKQLSQKKDPEKKPKTIEEILLEAAQGVSATIEAGPIDLGKYVAPVTEARFELPTSEGSETESSAPYIPVSGNEAEMRDLLEEREQILRDYERGSSEEIMARAESLSDAIRTAPQRGQITQSRPDVFLPERVGGEYKRVEDRQREQILGGAVEFTESIRGGGSDEPLKKKKLYLPKGDDY
jgi:hypothetical protein